MASVVEGVFLLHRHLTWPVAISTPNSVSVCKTIIDDSHQTAYKSMIGKSLQTAYKSVIGNCTKKTNDSLQAAYNKPVIGELPNYSVMIAYKL